MTIPETSFLKPTLNVDAQYVQPALRDSGVLGERVDTVYVMWHHLMNQKEAPRGMSHSVSKGG